MAGPSSQTPQQTDTGDDRGRGNYGPRPLAKDWTDPERLNLMRLYRDRWREYRGGDLSHEQIRQEYNRLYPNVAREGTSCRQEYDKLQKAGRTIAGLESDIATFGPNLSGGTSGGTNP